MDAEAAALLKENPCSTCKKEVLEDQEALLCDLCEWWEHVQCIKVCDRPTTQCYQVLTESPCNSIVFTCSRCRRKGTLARRLLRAETALESSQVQKDVYERLLQEKQQHIERVSIERDSLQMENADLEARLEHVRQQLDELRTERWRESEKRAAVSKVEADGHPSFLTPSTNVLPINMGMWSSVSSSRRKLPQIPSTMAVDSELAATWGTTTRTTSAVSTTSLTIGSPTVVSSMTSLHNGGARGRPLPELVPAGSAAVISSTPLSTTTVGSGYPTLLSASANAVNATSKSTFNQPPGFKELRERVTKFTGDGKEDFEVWLADYYEATGDCGWTDQLRARWFSWFLAGAAKHTWQRTLTAEDKASWASIVQNYKGHYGVHMDPRTAYLRCHELQYSDYTSVQGLLEAMKDYQRKAPDHLSNDNLISILWNKVPFKLQKEVGEIKDWSLQELLQRLLRAESRVEERERRTSQATPRRRRLQADPSDSNQVTTTSTGRIRTSADKSNDRQTSSGGTRELGLKSVKCFGCHKKGHVVSECPDRKKVETARVIQADVETHLPNQEVAAIDPWIRVLTASKEDDIIDDHSAKLVGPTFKVDVEVEGVKTRALVDNGSQVTLVRGELLPRLREHNGWTLEQCHQKNLPIKAQPIGASGQELGATSIVAIQTMMEQTRQKLVIPCFVLTSDKPVWQGTVKDCAMVLGTNAMVKFGMQTMHMDGTILKPSERDCAEEAQEGNVVLVRAVQLAPRQSKTVEVHATAIVGCEQNIGVAAPTKDMANILCDFQETLWTGTDKFLVTLNNWGDEPVGLVKDQQVGTVESATIVPKEDPVWTESETQVLLCKASNQAERISQLSKQLQFGAQLTSQARGQMEQMLLAQSEVFALCDEELGETDLVSHSIDTGDTKPVKTFPRRLPYALQAELEEEMSKLMNIGCIEPSTSSYASPLVLVRKKNGGLRVCVDYRNVNKDTVPDKYPMPRIDELVDMVGRRQPTVFSSLDLMRGYHQVKMSEDAKHKTAFTCHLGLYQYRRMPFGLTNAPATFQRLMSQLFSGPEWDFVFVYLDDILLASASIDEHLKHVEKVLQRLKQAGLRLKPSKCMFATTEIQYLGHTLTPMGVKPNDSKVTAVKDFPRPQTVKQVKSFLGLANFYRRHIRGMAVISRPLTDLTRKNCTEFVWTPACEEAFEEIKRLLVTAPLLHPPNIDKEFFLWTDASEKGFGAILEQEDDEGKRHPIAYASRATNSAEQKYAPTELEVAALVFALEHFQVYLLGGKVTVFTDHQALVSAYIPYLKSQTKGLLARWYLRLAPFLPNLILKYKPGTTNQAADALSRAPLSPEKVMHIEMEVVGLLTRKIQTSQREDTDLLRLIEYLENGSLPEDPVAAKKIATQALKGYYLVDGILFFEDSTISERRRMVVPTQLRRQVLLENHSAVFAGHFGPKKLLQRVSQQYYWPGMKGDTYQVCKSCVTCLSTQGHERRTKPPLKCIEVGEPFECIGMDIKEFDMSSKGNRYALVFQDYLTKWPEVYPLPDHKAPTVAGCLVDLIWRHGVPSRIIHDRAPEFLSDVFQDTAAVFGVANIRGPSPNRWSR